MDAAWYPWVVSIELAAFRIRVLRSTSSSVLFWSQQRSFRASDRAAELLKINSGDYSFKPN
ncbi:hypothetical protein [Gluconobacter frateurii]|uniref:Uncharacterized protein n=1 Tax=Gluconobacter frateurii NRIC 0228 TaxID=1307946 RepID=A0ABQ0QAY6_9PROT|nr:hypothetical protein [Gluconobacter frateurii]UMM09192.1 hypothetical protein MKW11_03735 [Gluconobacter frateurii]GBR11441.1 hypothetical protein AA0228_1377 [Gluconobacter frateurii NRIC 0228]GLP89108.1 hypothetical protein GCM10007868_01830 [Gluconobacter frateurii]